MDNTWFTRNHEWIRLEDRLGTVGVTDYAQQQLGDIVFVELPAVGTVFKAGDNIAIVESVKAASDLYSPVEGEVAEVNTALTEEPALVNDAPEGNGWLFKIKVHHPENLQELFNLEAYQDYLRNLD